MILPQTVVLLMFHTWFTNSCALAVQWFDLKLSKHNLHAPNAVANTRNLTRSAADPLLMLQLSVRKPADVVSFYSPTKDKDLQLDWWCRDCTGSSTEHHNLTDWSTRSLTNRISPFPPKPLSLPAAHSALCSLQTTAVHPFQQNGRQHMLTFV